MSLLQAGGDKKVTFMDPNTESSGVSRQVVPGVLLMPNNQSPTQVLFDWMITINVSEEGTCMLQAQSQPLLGFCRCHFAILF